MDVSERAAQWWDPISSLECWRPVRAPNGLSSDPDTVVVSSLNTAPVADAGVDRGVFAGQAVTLDGSASYDPDSDLLDFSWTLTAPDGSNAALSGENTAFPTFTPDIPGCYTATLTVNDPFGGVSADSVVVSVISAQQFAANQIASALNIVGALMPDQVTTRGNRQALQTTSLRLSSRFKPVTRTRPEASSCR